MIDVIGILGDDVTQISPSNVTLLENAATVVGSKDKLEVVSHLLAKDCTRVFWPTPLSAVIDHLGSYSDPIVILASGDPGFFGITRLLRETLARDGLRVHPTVSSVALGFARLALNWEDAKVISFHGRDFTSASMQVRRYLASTSEPKLAMLCSLDAPPETLCEELERISEELQLELGEVAVLEHLATKNEHITIGTPSSLMRDHFSPEAIVIATVDHSPSKVTTSSSVANADPTFANKLSVHRDDSFILPSSNYTKAEVRDIAVGKLELDTLPRGAIVCDVGAGQGGIAISIARRRPDIAVWAIEQDQLRAQTIRRNIEMLGVGNLVLLVSSFESAYADLPLFDAIFVGGGGPPVLNKVLQGAKTSIPVCATYASLEHAIYAKGLLGNLISLSVHHGAEIGTSGTRFVPDNPVFVAWRTSGGT